MEGGVLLAGERQLVARDEERRLLSVGGGLHLDEPIGARRLEREDVVAESVAAGGRDALDALGEVVEPQRQQARLLEPLDEPLPCLAERPVAGFQREATLLATSDVPLEPN